MTVYTTISTSIGIWLCNAARLEPSERQEDKRKCHQTRGTDARNAR